MDVTDLALLQKWGWLIPVIERVLRAIIFGIGASMLTPAVIKEEFIAVKALRAKTRKESAFLTYEVIRKYVSITFVGLWGIVASFATISLLREAYRLLQTGAK